MYALAMLVGYYIGILLRDVEPKKVGEWLESLWEEIKSGDIWEEIKSGDIWERVQWSGCAPALAHASLAKVCSPQAKALGAAEAKGERVKGCAKAGVEIIEPVAQRVGTISEGATETPGSGPETEVPQPAEGALPGGPAETDGSEAKSSARRSDTGSDSGIAAEEDWVLMMHDDDA